MLVATPDPELLCAAFRAFGEETEIRHADRPEVALSILEDARPRAAVLDADLEGGGLDLVSRTRRERTRLPIVVLTSHVRPELVNRTFFLAASLLTKPYTIEQLATFGRRALIRRFARGEGGGAIEVLCERGGLSPATCEIVAAACAGLSIARTSRRVGRSEDDVQNTLRVALRRVGVESLDQAKAEIDAILRDSSRLLRRV